MKDTSGSLANVLQKAANSSLDRLVYNGGLSQFAKRVARAQRFFLGLDAVEQMMKLCRSKPSTVFAAIKFARLPYPSVWLEWTPVVDEKEDDEFAPIRQGCLVEQYDDDHFAIFGCWQSSREDTARMASEMGAKNFPDIGFGLVISGVAIVAGVNGTAGRLRELEAKCFKIERQVMSSRGYDPVEQEAVNEMFAGFQMIINPYASAMYQNALQMKGFDPDHIAQNAVRDMAIEAVKMLGMLCLLTVKNCVTYEPVDNIRWNKARAKQGKHPMLDHTIVNISLNKASQRVANATGATAEERRRHLVLGHWKVRKSGVFFWHPHMRGHGETLRREGSIVHN